MVTYDEFINNILETRGRFACGDEYHERHHIIPRCIGGTNDEENLIDLFAKEHFEAHRLLALENPNNSKLIYAWYMISYVESSNQERYKLNAEEYEEIKKNYSQMLSEQMNGENNYFYGVHMYGENNAFYGKTHSEENKKKMSDIKKIQYIGEGNPFYGKHHSEETKAILREKNIGKKYSVEVNKKKARYGKDNASSHACIVIFDNGDIKEYDMIKSLIQDLNCSNASTYARGKLGTPAHYWKQGKCYIYYKEEYLKIILNIGDNS